MDSIVFYWRNNWGEYSKNPSASLIQTLFIEHRFNTDLNILNGLPILNGEVLTYDVTKHKNNILKIDIKTQHELLKFLKDQCYIK